MQAALARNRADCRRCRRGVAGRRLAGRNVLAPPRRCHASPAASAEPVAVLSANAGPSGRCRSIPQRHGGDGGRRRLGPPVGLAHARASKRRSTLIAASSGRRGFPTTAQLLATAGDDGLIKIWKPSTAESRSRYSSIPTPSAAWRSAATASSSSPAIATAACTSGRSMPASHCSQHSSPARCTPWPFRHDETLATAGSDKIVRLWNAETLSKSCRWKVTPARCMAVVQSRRPASGVGRLGRNMRLWDPAAGKLQIMEGHNGDIWAVAFSPTGQTRHRRK